MNRGPYTYLKRGIIEVFICLLISGLMLVAYANNLNDMVIWATPVFIILSSVFTTKYTRESYAKGYPPGKFFYPSALIILFILFLLWLLAFIWTHLTLY